MELMCELCNEICFENQYNEIMDTVQYVNDNDQWINKLQSNLSASLYHVLGTHLQILLSLYKWKHNSSVIIPAMLWSGWLKKHDETCGWATRFFPSLNQPEWLWIIQFTSMSTMTFHRGRPSHEVNSPPFTEEMNNVIPPLPCHDTKFNYV